jgi:hypothetical protein
MKRKNRQSLTGHGFSFYVMMRNDSEWTTDEVRDVPGLKALCKKYSCSFEKYIGLKDGVDNYCMNDIEVEKIMNMLAHVVSRELRGIILDHHDDYDDDVHETELKMIERFSVGDEFVDKEGKKEIFVGKL